MARRWAQLDVFTDRALEGNALAVVLDAEGLDRRSMQRIAREMNLSETTFVGAPEHGGTAHVRIFTPGMELPFAGHPTLGTGWLLARRAGLSRVVLEVAAGDVDVEFEPGGLGWLDHPGAELGPAAAEPLLAALRLDAAAAAPGLVPAVTQAPPRQALIALRDRETVDRAEFDPVAFAATGFDPATALYLFALEGERAYARMFAPAAGIAEDPATGSAAGVLGVYLEAAGLLPPLLTIAQGVRMGRPSRLQVRRSGGRLQVGGEVVLVAEGELHV